MCVYIYTYIYLDRYIELYKTHIENLSFALYYCLCFLSRRESTVRKQTPPTAETEHALCKKVEISPLKSES